MSAGLKAAVETIEKGVAALRDCDKCAAHEIGEIVKGVRQDAEDAGIDLHDKPVMPAFRTMGVG